MRMVALEEIATITAGQSPPGSTYNEDGLGLPFFQGKADFGEVHPTVRKWCRAPKKIAEAGDILLSVRAPVGPTNIAAERCCIGRGLAGIRPNNDKTVLPDFVHWAIKHREPHLVAKAQGSTFAAIGQNDLKSLLIPLPPLDEQRQIVNILNRAARIESLRTRAAERLREFVPALFVKMFGDPVENPMAWPTEPLGDCCRQTQYGTSKKANDRGKGMPVLRMGNVTYDGELDHTDLKHVELSDAEVTKHGLRSGDILFNRTNSRELVGKTAVWDGRFPAVAASYFVRLRLDESRVAPTYIWAAMNSAGMKRRLFTMARGAIGQANINATELRSIQLPVPPLDLQRRYAETVGTARGVARVRESSASTTEALMASLMSELLRNDVSVRRDAPA